MDKILIIYFDFSQIASSIVEAILNSYRIEYYKIKEGLFLVCSGMTPSQLFETILQGAHSIPGLTPSIFICEMADNKSYWGFMSGDLWKWIENHTQPM